MKNVSEATVQKWRNAVGVKKQRPCCTDALPLPQWYNGKRWTGDLATLEPRTYFVGWKGGPVKIGRAADPRKRLLELQTSCPYRLHLWALSSYPMHQEKRLHTRFTDHRMWGEWFSWHPELEAMMASLNGAKMDVLNTIRGK